MAGLQFSSGVDKGFEKDLQRMNQKMNGLSSNVKKQGGLINDSFKEIGATIAGIASIAALGKAGKEIITFSSDLQTALTEVSTISSSVTEDFDKYRQSLLDLSKTSSSSAIELTNAFYDVVSAGYDGAKGLEVLKVASLAGTAGFVDVGIAADGVTTVLNAWGKSANEASSVSDIFFKTVEKGKTTFPELGANIAKIAPIAASMNISFEESSAAIASITKQGTKTPEALTQIRAAMIAVNKVLGDGWAEAYTFQDALQEVSNAADGSQNKLKELVGTDEAVLAVLALTGENAKGAAEDLDAMTKSLGATEKAASKVAKTASQQSQILVNNILAALEPLGTTIVDQFASLASKLNEAFDSGDIQKYAKVLGVLISAFAAWKISIFAVSKAQKLNTVLTNLNAVAQRTSAITGKKVTLGNYLMAKSFKSLKAAFASNPIGLLVTGLTLAIPLISEFVESQSDMAKFASKVSSSIKEEQLATGDLFNELKKTNPKSKERIELAKELNGKYPDLLSNYDLENGSLEDIAKAQEAVNKSIVKRIALESQRDRIKEITSSYIEEQEKYLDALLNRFEGRADDATIAKVLGEIGNQIEEGGKSNVEIAKKAAEDLGASLDESSLIKKVAGIGAGGLYVQTDYELLLQTANGINKANEERLGIIDKTNAYVEALIGSEKELKDVVESVGKGGGEGDNPEDLTPEEIEENRKKTLKQLEIYNQKEINEITNNYGNKENLEKQFNDRILKQKIEYLTKLKTLTNDQLEKLRIEEDIINLKAQQNVKENNQDELDSLLEQYRSYAQKREDLILTANENIEKLQGIEGSTDAIAEIKKELEDKLSNLDIEFYSEETGLSELFKNDKERSLEEVQELVDGTKKLLSDLSTGTYSGDNYFGLSKELFDQIKDSPEAVEKIQNSFSSLANTSLEETNGKFEKSIELLDNINNLSDQLSDSLGEGTNSATILAKGLLSAASNSVGLIQSIKAVGAASSGLEKASGILALISAAVKVIQSVSNSINSAQKQKVQNYIKELQLINAVNLELINQIALYKEGNEFFATDRWGSALAGLDAYNQALVYQNELISKAAQTDSIRTSFEFKDSIGILPGLSALNERKQQKEILDYANGLTTEVEQALGSVAIRTQERTRVGRFFGASDQYDSLLKLYPKVINNNGEIDSQILKTILDTQDLADADRERLTQVLELTEKAEESYNQFGDYISSIFGGVADEVTAAFQEMYEGGDDAIKSLEGSFSDMIESFTRDAIEFAYLQPLITELNDTTKGLGIDFAKGNISADELQEDIISELGSFYDSLNALSGPIQEAYKNADELAAAAGFDSAFSGETTDNELAQATTSISDSITEQTGTEIKGRINAIMLSNQIISENSQQLLQYAVQNLVTLNKIKENTDYLPEIARNTKKTADRL